MFHRLFLDHPRAIGESYGEHLLAACGFGFAMIGGGLACLVHAIVPCVFLTTGSETINRLHGKMVLNRRRDLAEMHGDAAHQAVTEGPHPV